ncbi:multidrug efflux system membrane fusion protein [Inquilinus ginsengisoli]|uniref:Multidrug efflux system membrane fusion protein n=1 Tax=Inquilinus ginsengisoli TaxID=363840 RepID=A0ABU1JIT4_9PROT|nr:efflux RND transporter periplasmic adaptor subunit [Inquilinus ginsengisoli]MDR6288530.1 multidrug efflux system membrane fusion protein [Inquilinus ginsengisoli]
MKRSVVGVVAVLGIAIAAVAWQRFGNADAIERSGKTADAGGSAQAGSKTAAGGRPIPVVTVAAVQKPVATSIEEIGTVEPISTVLVTSRIDSQVMQVHVADGQTVQSGDLLFTLDDKPAKAAVALAQANLAKDQADRDQTAADVERDRPLVKTGAVSQQAFDLAMAASKRAEASVAADQANLDQAQLTLSYTQIKAPITGRLGVVSVTAGNLVKANTTNSNANSGAVTSLVTITQMTPIRIAFTVPERNLDAVRTAITSPTPPKVDAFDNDGKTHIASGQLTFIDSTVDTKSGTIPLKGTFANAGFALWPGQFVRVQLQLGTQDDAITVPTVALQAGQNGAFVFVARADGTAEVRPVTVARTVGDTAVVAQGLKPGEKVVTEGQLRLMEGSRITEKDAAGAAHPTTPPANGVASASSPT